MTKDLPKLTRSLTDPLMDVHEFPPESPQPVVATESTKRKWIDVATVTEKIRPPLNKRQKEPALRELYSPDPVRSR